MTRLSLLTILAAATLGAGAAGATTILSGSNRVQVVQSPGGTIVINGARIAPQATATATTATTLVSRSPVPVRRPAVLTHAHVRTQVRAVEPEVTRGFSLWPRSFLFWGPWAVEPAVEQAPRPAPRVIDEPVNRAETMMHRILQRLEL